MSTGVNDSFGNGVLSGLIEIPLPTPVPWTFDAPGWRFLIFAAVAFLAWRGWKMWRQWLADAYRREGIAELDDNLRRYPDWRERGRRLPILLKSVALYGFGREQVAALSGQHWARFLSDRAPSVFGETDLAVLLAVDYRAPEQWAFDEAALDACEQSVRRWIREHRGAGK